MASREYCTNVSEELMVWSGKLHDLSSKIDRLSTGEKQHLFSQIEGLHVIMTELDDRLCELLESCPLAEGILPEKEEREVNRWTGEVFAKAGENLKEEFDYEFGG